MAGSMSKSNVSPWLGGEGVGNSGGFLEGVLMVESADSRHPVTDVYLFKFSGHHICGFQILPLLQNIEQLT